MSDDTKFTNEEQHTQEEHDMERLELLAVIRSNCKISHVRDLDPISELPEAKGGATVIYTVEQEEGKVQVTAGVARCRPDEVFNKKKGCQVAAEKLLDDPIVIKLDLSSRCLIPVTAPDPEADPNAEIIPVIVVRHELPQGTFLANHLANTVVSMWKDRELQRYEQELFQSSERRYERSYEDIAAGVAASEAHDVDPA